MKTDKHVSKVEDAGLELCGGIVVWEIKSKRLGLLYVSI